MNLAVGAARSAMTAPALTGESNVCRKAFRAPCLRSRRAIRGELASPLSLALPSDIDYLSTSTDKMNATTRAESGACASSPAP